MAVLHPTSPCRKTPATFMANADPVSIFRRLKSGSVLLKYKQWRQLLIADRFNRQGSPELRAVFLSQDCTEFYWKSKRGRDECSMQIIFPPYSAVELVNVAEVRKGQTTEIFSSNVASSKTLLSPPTGHIHIVAHTVRALPS